MLKKLHGRKLAVCLIGGAMYALFSAFGWQAEHGGVIWAGGALLVAALLAGWLTGLFLKPIEALDLHDPMKGEAYDELSPLLTAMDQPLGHLPRLDVQPKAERFVRNGNRLTRRELIGDVQPEQPTRLYLNGQFCGIGRFDGETLKFDAMLLE